MMLGRSVATALLILAVMLGGLATYIAFFGWYPRYFDISWKEEVQLNSGRTMFLDVKRTYERGGLRRSKFEDATLRFTEVGFDTGSELAYMKFKTRLSITLLDQVNGQWYVVLYGKGPYGNHPDEMPFHWGGDFTIQVERLATLTDGKFVPIRWDLAPTGAIARMNIGPSIPSVEELAKLDGKTVSLDDKRQFKLLNPSGSGAGQISRPLRMKKLQGDAR